MKRLAVALTLALALTGCTKEGAEKELSRDVLPDVTLGELQGDGQVDVASLRGPLVVPLFANYCGPCRKELPLFERLSQEHGDEVRVLGLNWSDPQTDKAVELVEDTGVTFDVLADPQGETGEPPNPRIGYLPTLWMVDADGKVTYREAEQIESYDELLDLVEEHLDVDL
ncbi:TlpA disulfide reductase family protein [Nocardioides sp. cx-173]|uniref:TlpA family protein disulfide reductase n=1 Tax=Nocardioides sp. cx-173 TaxID=2898796 RepID=UPI001E2C89B6|nr:TlpA disulfide reductase family protein [Nocardioides sp. cx-173]MCD4523415.1 TlpA family protein disulfide reductase [Nocardioides sp. cx-173]UGB42246.1 TlpA family protein disulfide reductase [Nocardioides sp. cx-173]